MKLVWKDIISGWKNDLFPAKELEKLIRQTQEERQTICKGCPFNSTPDKMNILSTCKDCGCPLKKKTACLHCTCPQGKWLPVTKQEETEAINEYIKTKENESNNT